MTMLEGFDESVFTHAGETRPLYRRGRGPAVLVMHEIPGITPEVIRFAIRVVDAGFSVFMPQLFGDVGRSISAPYIARSLAMACIRREFRVLAARGASPLTDWLRALGRHAYAEVGGKGVGAIGMCITGNFALSLAMDELLLAPVLSQPSLPFPLTRKRRRSLHVTDAELTRLKERTASGLKVLGLRFTGDLVRPAERFERLREELRDGFEGIEIDSSPGNPYGIRPRAHSVVTTDLIDEAGHPTRIALERVLTFFKERLSGETSG